MRPGANTRLGSNPLGMWIETDRSGGDFRHPFLVTPGGKGARIGKGYVLGEVAVEPTIGGVPISGVPGQKPVPVLKLGRAAAPDELNPSGETWVCIEVTPDEDGKIGTGGAKVEVVQRAQPFVTQGKTGRVPLALLVPRAYGAWEVHQIAHFHLRYVTSKPAEGQRNHFFL